MPNEAGLIKKPASRAPLMELPGLRSQYLRPEEDIC